MIVEPTCYFPLSLSEQHSLIDSLMQMTTQNHPTVITESHLPLDMRLAKCYEDFCENYPRYSGEINAPVMHQDSAGNLSHVELAIAFDYVHNANNPEEVKANTFNRAKGNSLMAYKREVKKYIVEIALFNITLITFIQRSLLTTKGAK
jgi:hypothetical protein